MSALDASQGYFNNPMRKYVCIKHCKHENLQ